MVTGQLPQIRVPRNTGAMIETWTKLKACPYRPLTGAEL
jgi:hypothetical protein